METVPENRLQHFLTLLWLAFAALFRRMPRTSSWHAPADWGAPADSDGPAPALSDLQRVIPIVASQTRQDLTITLISVECYAQGFLLHGSHSPKYGEVGHGNVFHFLPIFEAHDDTGTAYRWWSKGSDRNRFTGVFAPALHPDARELRLDVSEVRWIFFDQRRQLRDTGPWSFTVDVDGNATRGS